MHNGVNSGPATPGRTRSSDLTEKILNETWAMFQAHGVSGVDIEAVARRVGCGKTSIYRRWATKSELLSAAFMHTSDIGTDPDTGNLLSDLLEFCLVNVKNQQGRMSHVILQIDQPEVTQTLWEEFYLPRQELAYRMLRRGIDRGELAKHANLADILDLISGLTLFRNAVRGQTTTRADLERILPAILSHPPLLHEPPETPPPALC